MLLCLSRGAREPFPISAVVRGHEKVPVCGRVEVSAGGQLKSPSLARRVVPEVEAQAVTVAVS